MADEQIKLTLVERLGRVDRRIIFLLMGVAVLIPLLVHYTTTIPASPIVQDLFDMVESMPAGSKVLLTLDYGPATAPENQPMVTSFARHCFEKGHKIYMISLWATGPRQAMELIDDVIKPEFPNKVNGVDWVHLGFKAGGQGLINTLLSDFTAMYTTDVDGRSIREIPMMAGIKSLRDFDLIYCAGSGQPGNKEWIQFAGDPGHIPVGGGTTAVMAPQLYPYYPKQTVGLLGGLQGAAEYEAALMVRYPKYRTMSRVASTKMGPQVSAHLVIAAFIILGNVTYLIERKRQKKGK
jgi:hypothetical protein